MAEVLILEFPDATADQYFAVNHILGFDVVSGEGNWPPTLRSHTAAFGAGGLVVIDIWESRQDQAAYTATHLGPAIAEVGLGEPARREWLSLLGHYDA